MSPQDLSTLIEQLQNYDLSYCDMHHEKVKRAADGIEPILNPQIDHGFQRLSFCSSESRRNCLACAHTIARSNLIQALDALPPTTCPPRQLQKWRDELRELEIAVAMVDYKKNRAEIEHAKQSAALSRRNVSADQANTELAQINSAIEEIVAEHRGYVDRLRACRDEILSYLS